MRVSWGPLSRDVSDFEFVGLVAGVGFLLARFVPLARLPFWFCPLRRSTGWPCPGCGLTRVAERLAHGRWASALAVHPFGAVAGIGLMAVAGWTLLHFAFGLPTPRFHLRDREAFGLRVAAGVLLILNYAFVVVMARLANWL